MRVGGITLTEEQLRPGLDAMQPGFGIDFFEAWDIASALRPMALKQRLNATYIADRLLQRERRAGRIRHRGRGQWVRVDD